MKQFWKTEKGKIFMHGIHEHNSALGLINSEVYFLKEFHSKLSQKDINERLDRIENQKKKAIESMDYIYENIKKLEGF